MCNSTALDVITQKFGYQRALYAGNQSNEQKALNGFDTAVYFPTNWRNSGYNPQMAKFPNFIRYGGLVPVNPEWFQKNFLGTFSLKEQPTVQQPDAFTIPRYS